MLVVTGALLLNGLFSAKAALHQRVMLASRTEMVDATSRFVQWARSIVKTDGAGLTSWPKMIPVEIAMPVQPENSDEANALVAVVAWTVNGTSASDSSKTFFRPQSVASNTAQEINEQRISSLISVKIKNRAGAVLDSLSQEVTARIFDSDPYLIVTAVKSQDAVAEPINSSEGDTGGFVDARSTNQFNQTAPYSGQPALFADTTIQAQIECHNTNGASQTTQSSSGLKQLITVRHGGNIAYALEAPCKPTFLINSYPDSYAFPSNGLYVEGAPVSKQWFKNDQSSSSMPN